MKQTFDIRIFDTFYVIRLKNLYWWLAGISTAYWLFYKFIKINYYSNALIGIHIILTMLLSLLTIIFHISSGQLYIFNTNLNLYDVLLFQKNNLILTILLMVLAGVQLIFAFNFLGSLRKVDVKSA